MPIDERHQDMYPYKLKEIIQTQSIPPPQSEESID